MAAFERAVGLGYRYLELDVRATADGEVVVFHDATLDRVTGQAGRVGRRSWSSLHAVRVREAAPIPQLAEVLSAWPEVRVNIDPKHDAVVEPLARVLRAPGVLERVCVMAFSDRRLVRMRALLGPGLCTALGPASMTRLRIAASNVRIRPPVGEVAQLPARLGGVQVLGAPVLAAARELDLPVHAWVVDDPAEMRRLLDLGVDGLMTDRPSELRAVLAERGQWPTDEAPRSG